MSAETVEVLKEPADEDPLVARLATVERAYEDLLQRLHRYERERAEIRARLERILSRIPPAGSALP
jgi:hypothetical protein